ncbi:MAG: acyltransferase [Actinomycetes bacterium]
MFMVRLVRAVAALGATAWSRMERARVWPAVNSEPDYLMALRGVAVLGVALGHVMGNGRLSLGALVSNGAYGYEFHAQRFEWWRSVIEIFTPLIGENFVLLFFVQSGYLMGKVFFEGRYDAVTQKRAFFSARFLRLAPLLYFNLIVCLLLFPYSSHDPIKIVGDFLFITNFTGRSINLVTWSLSHEMQYYVICPFVFLLFRSRTLTAFGGAIALTVAAYLIPRLFTIFVPFQYVYTFLAGFSANLFLATYPVRLTHTRKRDGMIVGLLIIHFGYNCLFLFGHTVVANLVAVVSSVAMVVICEAQSENRPRDSRLFRFAIFMGFLTYGFYLWHYPLLQLSVPVLEHIAQGTFGPTGWLTMALFHALGIFVVGVGSLVISFLTYVFIEMMFRPSLYASLVHSRRLGDRK